MLNLEQFKCEHIFSDLRYEKLLTNEKRCHIKDVNRESGALFGYMSCLQEICPADGIQLQKKWNDENITKIYTKITLRRILAYAGREAVAFLHGYRADSIRVHLSFEWKQRKGCGVAEQGCQHS